MTSLAWPILISYLTDRGQYVQIGSAESSKSSIFVGVLQGLILGRLFFLLYVNNFPDCLPENSNKSESTLYANDTTFMVIDGKNSFTKLTENLEMHS